MKEYRMWNGNCIKATSWPSTFYESAFDESQMKEQTQNVEWELHYSNFMDTYILESVHQTDAR